MSEVAIKDINTDGGEYLTFYLANEEYGVDILSVRGIQGWSGVTRIPDTPAHQLGVINLRGAIVPIVDLRLKFGLGDAQFGPTTVVIIVAIEVASMERIIGLVVDAVSEVYHLSAESIQPNPGFAKDTDNDLVKGLSCIEQKMVIMLDLEKLSTDWVAANQGSLNGEAA